MELFNFYGSQQLKDIKGSIPTTKLEGSIVDKAFEINGKIYFVRTQMVEYCDEDSRDAFNITNFMERNAEEGVYLSPRRNSIFRGNLENALTLLKEGYKIYPVEEYEHSSMAIHLLAGGPIKTQKAIETGSFRIGASLTCRFDSSFAFWAQPKSWSKPNRELLNSFASWMNGEVYRLQVLCATRRISGFDGGVSYDVEVLEEDYTYYYGSSNAEAAALDDLRFRMKELTAVAA
jgi:hypothetical protein